jgi:hypothetical protein
MPGNILIGFRRQAENEIELQAFPASLESGGYGIQHLPAPVYTCDDLLQSLLPASGAKVNPDFLPVGSESISFTESTIIRRLKRQGNILCPYCFTIFSTS